MKDKTRILLVDDDVNIARLVQLYLEKEGYEVETAQRGDDAVAACTHDRPDLMLLDVMLPGMDGWQVLKEVRRTSAMPIIMLTAKEDTFDKVLGLELGADDYITKPFDTKELIARVKAVLRRAQTPEEPAKPAGDTLTYAGLSISLARYEVQYEGKTLDMPPKELEVLYFLASHPNEVFSREQLLEQVWGYNFVGESSRTVDVHIKRLREKLPESERYGWCIRTIWSVGYKFELK